jgi:sulfoxide reductase catalytic subunit YedY
MVVPWTGFPLAALLRKVEPLPAARFVRFVSFYRPAEADRQNVQGEPWPYNEGLTLAEATNELTFVATGMYGHPLLKQHGAPVRLVVPWKYGFKSAKSIVRMELTAGQPATFWNTAVPAAYDFQANVNPNVPHPNWSQANEYMLGTRERRPTQLYNGYGEETESARAQKNGDSTPRITGAVPVFLSVLSLPDVAATSPPASLVFLCPFARPG